MCVTNRFVIDRNRKKEMGKKKARKHTYFEGYLGYHGYLHTTFLGVGEL